MSRSSFEFVAGGKHADWFWQLRATVATVVARFTSKNPGSARTAPSYRPVD